MWSLDFLPPTQRRPQAQTLASILGHLNWLSIKTPLALAGAWATAGLLGVRTTGDLYHWAHWETPTGKTPVPLEDHLSRVWGSWVSTEITPRALLVNGCDSGTECPAAVPTRDRDKGLCCYLGASLLLGGPMDKKQKLALCTT